MISFPHILAEGFPIPIGLIFGVILVALWAIGTVVSSVSKKPTPLSRPSPQANDLAAIRRRMLEEQSRQKRSTTSRPKAKPKRKAQPPPIPQPAAALVVRSTLQHAATIVPPVMSGEIGSATGTVSRGRSSETARNVRLLLQRNGLAEAFVLGEVLGKPKALRDD